MVEYAVDVATVFAALGSPVRCAIVERLRAGEARVTDLARPFPMSLAAVSKHVQVLERAGIVHRTIEGRVHRIALDPRTLVETRRWFDGVETFWNGRLDTLAGTLSEGSTRSGAERSA